MPDNVSTNEDGNPVAPGIEKYEHYGSVVSVRSDLKGRHKEHCLCLEIKRIDAVLSPPLK